LSKGLSSADRECQPDLEDEVEKRGKSVKDSVLHPEARYGLSIEFLPRRGFQREKAYGALLIHRGKRRIRGRSSVKGLKRKEKSAKVIYKLGEN